MKGGLRIFFSSIFRRHANALQSSYSPLGLFIMYSVVHGTQYCLCSDKYYDSSKLSEENINLSSNIRIKLILKFTNYGYL